MTLTADRYLRQFLFTEGTLGVVVQTALQTLKTEGVTARCRHGLVKQPKKEERKHVRLETRSRTDKHICGLWLCNLFVKYEWNNYSEIFGWILWDLYLIQSGHSRSAGSKIGLTSGLSDSVTGSGEKNNHTINNVTPDIVWYIYQKKTTKKLKDSPDRSLLCWFCLSPPCCSTSSSSSELLCFRFRKSEWAGLAFSTFGWPLAPQHSDISCTGGVEVSLDSDGNILGLRVWMERKVWWNLMSLWFILFIFYTQRTWDIAHLKGRTDAVF